MSDILLPISVLSLRGKDYKIIDTETRDKTNRLLERESLIINQLTDETGSNTFQFATKDFQQTSGDVETRYGFIDSSGNFVPFTKTYTLLAVGGQGRNANSYGPPRTKQNEWFDSAMIKPLDTIGEYSVLSDMVVRVFYSASPPNSTDTTSYTAYAQVVLNGTDVVGGPVSTSDGRIGSGIVSFNVHRNDVIAIQSRTSKSYGGYNAFIWGELLEIESNT